MTILRVSFTISSLLFATTALAQSNLITAPATMPFVPGEKLEYKVGYGMLPAGTLETRVNEMTDLDGREAYHFVFEAVTNKTVSVLFDYETHEEAWFDANELYSLKYQRDSVENDKQRSRIWEYDQENNLRIKDGTETKPTSPRAVDQLSMIYFLRLLPYKLGAQFVLENQADPNDNPIRVQVIKKERLTVPAGTFQTFVVQLNLKTDSGIFKEGGDNLIWVTTDANRIPVKISSKVGLGSFKAELVTHSVNQVSIAN